MALVAIDMLGKARSRASPVRINLSPDDILRLRIGRNQVTANEEGQGCNNERGKDQSIRKADEKILFCPTPDLSSHPWTDVEQRARKCMVMSRN